MKIHVFHLIVLFIILIIGGGLFLYLNNSKGLQLFVGILTSIAYVIWGVLHHSYKGDLHKRVVVEYVLIGSIAIIVLTIIVRG